MVGIKFRVASGREDFEAVQNLYRRRYGGQGARGIGLSRTARGRLVGLIRTGSLVVAADRGSNQTIGAVPLDFVSFDNALLVPFNLAPENDRGRVLRLQFQLVIQATIHSGVGRILLCADEAEDYQRAVGQFNARLAEQQLPVSLEILGTVDSYFDSDRNVAMSSLFIRRAQRPDLSRQAPAAVNAIIRTAYEVSRSSFLVDNSPDAPGKNQTKDIIEKANADKQADTDKVDKDNKDQADIVKLPKDDDKAIDKLDKEGEDKENADKDLTDKIDTDKVKDASEKGDIDKDKDATDKNKELSDKEKEATDKTKDDDKDKDATDKSKELSDKTDDKDKDTTDKDKEASEKDDDDGGGGGGGGGGGDKDDGDTEPDTRRSSASEFEADLIGTRQAVIYRRLRVDLPESARRDGEV
jgi:hypothetical protein